MKFLQFLISPSFRISGSFSLKSLLNDSSYKIRYAKKTCNRTYSVYNRITSNSSIYQYHTSCCILKNGTQGSAMPQTKKRLQRKIKLKEDLNGKTCTAIAYSSAEGYTMLLLKQALENQGLYNSIPLPEDAGNDLHLCKKKESSEPTSHIFIFSEGCIVFWNVPKPEQKDMLNFLKPYEVNSYDPAVVNDEKEDLDYIYSEDETKLNDGCAVLNIKSNVDLQAYTFSNSLAQSVKLGILEDALEKYSSSLEWVTDKMKKGEKIKMSRNEIFAKRGELFSLRHAINLSSDLLDTPDFYWDRKDLEILYLQTSNYLDIPKRTRTVNLRLSYCSELVDLLVNHMNDEHHVRLEWMIIVLIMVEVVFECIHFAERFTT